MNVKLPPQSRSQDCFDTELLPREKKQGSLPIPCPLVLKEAGCGIRVRGREEA